MKKINPKSFILIICLLSINYSSMAQEQVLNVETPIEIMTKACNSYKNLPQANLKALISIDEIGEDGLRVQKNSVVEISVKLPNKFKADSQGDENYSVFFDGSKVTALDTFTNFYAQAPLSGNLLDFLDVTQDLHQPTPGLDIIVPQYCLSALANLKQGQILGTLKINEKYVQHLVFYNSSDNLSFQVWVDKSQNNRYVIRKALISSTSESSVVLDYEYLLISEDISTPIFDGIFDFIPNQNFSETKFFTTL